MFFFRALKLFFSVTAAFCVGCILLRFCYKQTDGFAAYKIRSKLTPSKAFKSPALSVQERKELEALFDQPFYYLGKGAQVYVFESQDGSTVIKFCRFDHLRPPLWFTAFTFPLPFEKERVARFLHKRGRLEREFESYQIAFKTLKEQTGLIYLHLNKTDEWHKTLTVYDKIRVRHQMDLDQMEFIIQKKASLIYPTLERWMKQGSEEKAKQALVNLVRLLKERCQEGIFDKDPDLATNFGFIGTDAIQIDTGRFSREVPSDRRDTKKEMKKITHRLGVWLEENQPSLYAELEKALEVL